MKPIVGRTSTSPSNLAKNFTELTRRVQQLCDKRGDIRDKIDRVKQQQEPTRECIGWLADVDRIEKQAKMIEEDHLVDKRRFKGWFPDTARAKLGERVVEMIQRVKELQEKSDFEGGFVTNLPPEIVKMRRAPNLSAETSANRNLKKILDCIGEKNIRKIGIWGIGGVGKTALMKAMNNSPKVEKMFDFVIWVSVLKSWNVRKLQVQVANCLNLNLDMSKMGDNDNIEDNEVSTRLHRELEGKKYLLLLNGVWERVDLSKVGIPSINQDSGCKVILTTRELKVCHEMETDVEIQVETLSNEESWKMFESKVGEIVRSPTIKPIAEEIVRECGGLPLALNVVGGALRKVEDADIWHNLLKKLKSPDMSTVNNVSDRLFGSLKVIYDQLKDSNIKNCFLYCNLYPEGHEISKSQLINYWRAEGLLPSKRTLEEARVEGLVLLRDLGDLSLLEKCEDGRHVKVHDVVRDLVLKMTSPGGEESRQMVRAGLCRDEIPDDKDWEDAIRISFMFNQLYNLPEMPNCPNLLTLLLQSKDYLSSRLQVIPESFFNHMPSLRVLDLSDTGIISLPSSISNLVSLRALLLKRCRKLKALPREVRALKLLEVLCLTENNMACIPSAVWELTGLRCFKFSSEVISLSDDVINLNGILSKLRLLEKLDIFGDDIKDETKKSWEVLQKELGSLTRLSSLRFRFGNASDLKHFLLNSKQWRHGKLTKFVFYVGHEFPNTIPLCGRFTDQCKPYKSCLGYEGGSDGDNIIPSAVMDVLLRSEFFALVGHNELRKLSDLGVENTNGLKYCRVCKCDAIENIVDEAGLRANAFANLECLVLQHIKNLESICRRLAMQSGTCSSSSFTNLRHLELCFCNGLRTLFTWQSIPQFLNLELLRIIGCDNFVEMISVDDVESSSRKPECVMLPKLKRLELCFLQEFVHFSKGNVSFCWPSLQEVSFFVGPKLEFFPFGVDSAPNLRKIYGPQQWWEALKWEDDNVKLKFSPFFYPIDDRLPNDLMNIILAHALGKALANACNIL
ncbi:probable disease resistance protein At4g27220 [Cornus florida]|uniref:probable disease resistance protein At4g27220 n=1 Tax=Cornus florida TaxID=4283 RepID=UPI00289AE455|nr:probable disease resistance protein At4g27220 [Cornus florida]XP_059652079.1 probable disease resistance protein At4g27220 [Cornus florida]